VALPDDQKHMQLAIQEARRSRGEDGKIHPYVGAVVVRDGQVLGTACRGDLDPREHAEFSVLEKKLPREKLAGCTVYTSLEPCTTRNHPKVTCADRLIERRVSRVVIGMLDPDQRITGKGILKLRRAGIGVELFPQTLMAELEELNRDFTRDREKKAASADINGIVEAGLTAFYPSRDYYARFRDEASTIDRYVSTAKSTTVLVSVNLMTGIPFHDLCVALERKLTAPGSNFSVVISPSSIPVATTSWRPSLPFYRKILPTYRTPSTTASGTWPASRMGYASTLGLELTCEFTVPCHLEAPYCLTTGCPPGGSKLRRNPTRPASRGALRSKSCARNPMAYTMYCRRPTMHSSTMAATSTRGRRPDAIGF
jgi:pyrimidine deaminase RibD-like protein